VASTVTKLIKHVERTGRLKANKQGGDRRSDRIEAHADEILSLVAATPDITLEEIAALLKDGHGETFAVSTIWRCLDRHGLTFKKNSTRQRAAARRRSGGPSGLARSPA
jgi:transposase